MMSKQKIIYIAVGMAVVAGLSTFLLAGQKGEDKNLTPGFNLSGIFGGNKDEETIQPKSNETGQTALREGFEIYADGNYGFSFRHPKDATVSAFPEGDIGYTVLVQKAGSRESFQIFVIPFDEEGPLTPERVRQDLPEIAIESPLPVKIGDGKAIDALIFNSNHESLGKTREAWFIWPPSPQPHGNYLYQITTYADMDGFLGPILDTLKFKN